ncbi:MAG: hypothetical protein RJB38_535 [Pseudomonadota bacterium]|jgi:cell division protein FtsB
MKGNAKDWFPGWIWPVFLFLTIGSVWVRLSIVKTTYAVTQADRNLRSLRQDREQIELRVAGLKSPRRLEMIARSRFGLAQPRADQVVHLGTGSR